RDRVEHPHLRAFPTRRSSDLRWQISPRIGFVWDVFKDKSLKVRGGTGVFTGRLPLVFFTNMPTNASMVQNSVTFKTQYDNGKVVDRKSTRLNSTHVSISYAVF